MAALLVYPGTKGAPVALVDVLHEHHEQVRAYVDSEIKIRRENRAPLIDETSGNAIEPLGEYEPDDRHAGIVITMAIVSDAQRREWDVRHSQAVARYREATKALDVMGQLKADEEIWKIMGEVVGTVVVEIKGVDGLSGSVADAADALRAAGLLTGLYEAARYFTGLPRPKALRCGQPQP